MERKFKVSVRQKEVSRKLLKICLLFVLLFIILLPFSRFSFDFPSQAFDCFLLSGAIRDTHCLSPLLKEILCNGSRWTVPRVYQRLIKGGTVHTVGRSRALK